MRAALTASLLALAATASAGAASKPVAFFGCRAIGPHPAPIVRPHSMVVACADGNFYFTSIAWTSWTPTTASASATAHANNCRPNCAAGHFHTYRVAIQLSKPRSCKGRVVFTRVTWRFLGARPVGAARSDGENFPC